MLVGTALLTVLSTIAFGADVATVNELLSLAGCSGAFVALAYTVGWTLDGVVVGDGTATFAEPR